MRSVPATPSPFHHLAHPLDSRQSDTGSMPMLDWNTPHSTSQCPTLDTCCRDRACNPVTFPSPRMSSRQSTVERWLDADARLEHSTLDVAMPDARHLTLDAADTVPATRHLSITLPVFSTVDSRMLARHRCSTLNAPRSTLNARHSTLNSNARVNFLYWNTTPAASSEELACSPWLPSVNNKLSATMGDPSTDP
jgi:hypothetical protein